MTGAEGLAGRIVPVVLAAGASSRMGRPKAALDLAGRTALRHVLDACAAHGLARAVVVLGAHADAVRAAASGAAVAPAFVVNEAWVEGRSTSIRAGLARLDAAAAAFLLWPVDVPLAGAAVPALVLALERDREAGAPFRAWLPSHAGRRGHPALFLADVAAALASLARDRPARDVVRALADEGRARHVLVGDPAVLWDMDDAADHARLAAEAERRALPPRRC